MFKAVPVLLLALILVANVQGQSGPDEDDQDDRENGISYFRIETTENQRCILGIAFYLMPFGLMKFIVESQN